MRVLRGEAAGLIPPGFVILLMFVTPRTHGDISKITTLWTTERPSAVVVRRALVEQAA